jgi:hypothetical protein
MTKRKGSNKIPGETLMAVIVVAVVVVWIVLMIFARGG